MSRRALVVDDDRVMVRTLGDVLRVKGWEVTPAYTGIAAVEAMSAGAFDVVLMDIKMPGMDGVAAFKAMKAAHPGVRVILMTAYAAHDLIVEAEREGVVQVMSKPVNIPLLLGTMTQALNREQSVLVIDHDDAFLRTLSDVLRLNGFAAVLADDLDQARRAVVQHQPVAVLLHMHLGKATPRDAVRAVHEVNPAVALILYSGHADGAEEVRQTLPHNWIHGYLQKPFDVDQITGMLDAIRSNG